MPNWGQAKVWESWETPVRQPSDHRQAWLGGDVDFRVRDYPLETLGWSIVFKKWKKPTSHLLLWNMLVGKYSQNGALLRRGGRHVEPNTKTTPTKLGRLSKRDQTRTVRKGLRDDVINEIETKPQLLIHEQTRLWLPFTAYFSPSKLCLCDGASPHPKLKDGEVVALVVALLPCWQIFVRDQQH